MNQALIRSIRHAVASTLITALMILICSLEVHAVDLTAEEILQRSKEAMAPPIRYRMTSKGVGVNVYQKILSDGVSATRIETPVPNRRISLLLGSASYEFYPDKGVGIDSSVMHQSAASQAAALSAAIGGASPVATAVKKAVADDGRECYEITMTYPASLVSALANGLPETARKKALAAVPRESRTTIDQKTFVTIETRVISNAGTTISHSEYRDIERQAELPDDLFLPPDGVELLKPRTTAEYMRIVMDVLKPEPVRLDAPQRVALIRPKAMPTLPKRMDRPQIDPRTGRIIAPLPSRSSRLQPVHPPDQQHSAKPPATPEDFLRRSIEAMRPPIRYRVVCNGATSVVSQKVLEDGHVATRVESSSAEQQTRVVLGKRSWELYPSRGLAIDTTQVGESFTSQAATAPWADDSTEWKRGKDVKVGGRECVEFVAAYPSHLSGVIVRAFGRTGKNNARVPVPHGIRAVIDKTTFEIVEMRLETETGASRLEFQDIEHHAELSDDLFLPPSAIGILEARDALHYVGILREHLGLKSDDTSAMLDRRPEIDARTGLAVPPLSLGARRTELERRIGSLTQQAVGSKRKPIDRPAQIDEPGPQFVSANLLPESAGRNDIMPSTDEEAASGLRRPGRRWLMPTLFGLTAALSVGVLIARKCSRASASHRPKSKEVIPKKKRSLIRLERRPPRRD